MQNHNIRHKTIKSDFIIVGQGLAGSVLAIKLINKGYSVIVIDQPELSSCSKVGGGSINPVVFKRLTKSWMADELLPVMREFYRWCEEKFNCTLLVNKPMVKLFTEKQESDLWMKKAAGEMQAYLDTNIYYTNEFNGVNIGEGGYSIVKETAAFIMPEFLEGAKKFISENGNLVNENFDYSKLQFSDTVKYKNIEASKIIFAEGYLIKNNPLFNYIPFKPVKGELLTFTSDSLNLGNYVIKKSSFVASIYGNVFKTGATYNWDSINDEPTDGGREELESKLRKLISSDYTIIKHEAGVRPAGIDRRPILGAHPTQNQAFVFNGLGAKGVILSPYFADHFINYIVNGAELNNEVNVARFNKFFVN